ncbi:MAG TPA: DUF4402 domain-containing protein [Bacteroidales bacterium]|jgi:hypothetical protein|nr:DUF4402 domain-containing protein [Bacteroidales bacterium]HNT92411.1 DUF4402 domain-containing protein [Bacteroidales bacterium]HPE21701.1 DUF4402 domain-containing protein [Bacteroidales bacterium]HPJ04460.1 DUF4402 domain-containing protein [Bacteroidales bacterium]HPQ63026.1 DUF4402 domain-containing protein [Bacteroidales bacterium]
MRRLIKGKISLWLLLLVSVTVAEAQPGLSSTVTGHITAEVISTLTAVETSQLSFGKFSPGPQGGSLILNPENTISVMGSVWPGSGTHSAASFYVTGDPGVAYTVSLPSSPVTITHVSSARTMTVEDWTSVPFAEPGAGLLENGSQVVYVGATLRVGTINDNPVGVYTGTYTITFVFN